MPYRIACTLADGRADVGFGIKAEAARDDFAMRTSVAGSAEDRQPLARLQGNTLRQRLMAMPGYALLPQLRRAYGANF